MAQLSQHPKGAAALIALMGVAVFSLMVLTSVSAIAQNAFQVTLNETATERTFFAAEAGLNEGLQRLVHNAAPQSFAMDFNGVAVSATISSNPLNPYQRVIESRAQDSTGKVRTLEIIANTSSFAGGFDHAVQTGAGGLYMDSNSTIIGNIYSNGIVTGKSSAISQGNVVVAGSASVEQHHETQNTEFSFGQASPVTDVAQSFTAAATGTIDRISVKIKKVGSPNPDNLWWKITADNSGKPATTHLGSATGKFSDAGVSPVGISLAWVNINLPTPLSISAGTKYWIVLDATNNASNYWVSGVDSADGYTSGSGFSTSSWSSGSAVWSPVEVDGADLNFITWLGGENTRLENIIVRGNAYANRITGTGGSSYARVCGDAYYDTILDSVATFLNSVTAPAGSDCPSPWTQGAGYPGSADRPVLPLPLNNTSIQIWKDEIGTVLPLNCRRASGNGPNDTFCVNTNQSLGNQKIVGDLYVAGDVTLTLTGNTWVTGKVLLDNSGTSGVIKLSASLGAGSAVLISDDKITVDPGANMQGSGDSRSFLLVVSMSTSMDVGDPAVYAGNNATSIIYGAPNGMLKVKNGGELNAAVAQQLYLEPNSIVTYNPNLIYFTVPSGSDEPVGTALGTWHEK